MKNRTFKILTILGSPHDAKSNTRAFRASKPRFIHICGVPALVVPTGNGYKILT